MRILCLLLITFSLTPLFIKSQCLYEDKIEYLHVNDIRAAILNRGDAFWDLNRNARFQVPYFGPESPSTIFASALWLAGKTPDDDLRIASLDYRLPGECGYTPGPLADIDPIDRIKLARQWNTTFFVSGEDIVAHIEDYKDGRIDEQRSSIFGWPANGNEYFMQIHGLEPLSDSHASFHETPGHENGIYEPQHGEYPHVDGMDASSIPGAIFWCVYHPDHSLDFNLEIQQTTWAMACPDDLLSVTLFTRFTISNTGDPAL